MLIFMWFRKNKPDLKQGDAKAWRPPSKLWRVVKGLLWLVVINVSIFLIATLVVWIKVNHDEKVELAKWEARGYGMSQEAWENNWPPTERNPSSWEIEELAAKLGVDLSVQVWQPKSTFDYYDWEITEDPLSTKPTECLNKLSRVRGKTKSILGLTLRRPGNLPEKLKQQHFNQGYQDYTDAYRKELLAVIDHQNLYGVPVWRTGGIHTSWVNRPKAFERHQLQKFIFDYSLNLLQTGKLEQSEAALFAAWKLRDPPPFTDFSRVQLWGVSYVATMGVLRRHPNPDPIWQERLLGTDPRGQMLHALQGTGFLYFHYFPYQVKHINPIFKPWTYKRRHNSLKLLRETVELIEASNPCENLQMSGGLLGQPKTTLANPLLAEISEEVTAGLSDLDLSGELYGPFTLAQHWQFDRALTIKIMETRWALAEHGWPEDQAALDAWVEERGLITEPLCPDRPWRFTLLADGGLEVALGDGELPPIGKAFTLPGSHIIYPVEANLTENEEISGEQP